LTAFPSIPRLVGRLLSAAALGFVLWKMGEHREALVDWHASALEWAVLMACTLVYGAAGFLLSSAWREVLRSLRCELPSQRVLHAIYGRSQIAKYLPGNVFHLVGRHVAGRALGLGHRELALAAALEMAGLMIAATAVAMPVLTLDLARGVSAVPPITPLAVVALAMLLLAAGFSVLRWTRRASSGLGTAGPLIRALLLQVGFFGLSGLLYDVCVALNAPDVVEWWQAPGLFALAWLGGFIVPGAPGGLGIRETLMLALLGPLIGEAEAMLAAILMRAITLVGDMVFFVLTLRLGSQPGP
jgi:uncharacterized membrane protein YbhN (UPF0104 family)